MMRFLWKSLLGFLFLFFLLSANEVYAQEGSETIELRVVRIFGFRAGSQLQGRIGLRVEGPQDLIRVEFYLDDEMIGEDDQAPFQYDFSTGDFSPGEHTIRAIGYTEDGKSLLSNVGTYTFISSDEAFSSVQKIVIPILIGVVVLVAIGGVISAVMGKRKESHDRIGDYGPAGGAVCKRCGMPFARHVFSPNLLIGKLERCPYCGAIAIVRRGTPVELRTAEEHLRADRQEGREAPEEDEDERMRRMLDESRFDQ
jgi:hypothetical protein